MVPASELLSISMLGYRCWSTHNPISIPSPVTERASNVQPAVLLQWAEHLPDVRTLQKECLECFLSCKFIAWDWMDSGSDFLVYTSCPLVTSPSKQVQISGFQIFFFFLVSPSAGNGRCSCLWQFQLQARCAAVFLHSLPPPLRLKNQEMQD